MNLLEAVSKLDIPKDEDYGKIIIKSNTAKKYLVNSKYCICECTNEYPISYRVKKEHFELNDWEIDIDN